MAVLGAWALLAGGARATEIAAVLSSSIEPYTAAYEQFAADCPANYWVTDLDEGPLSDEETLREIVKKKPDLIVAIGSRAFHAAAEATERIPVVFLMVLEHSEDRPAANVAGASIRVDPAVEMKHIRMLFPKLGRLGVVYDPANSEHVVAAAKKAAAKEGIELVARPVSSVEEAFGAYRELETAVDGWWMIPDRTTLTKETSEFLIVESLRRGMPLVAPAKKYVEQGANIALVPEYAAIGGTGARIALQILGGQSPEKLGVVFAEEVRLVVNERTSREAGARLGGLASRADIVGR